MNLLLTCLFCHTLLTSDKTVFIEVYYSEECYSKDTVDVNLILLLTNRSNDTLFYPKQNVQVSTSFNIVENKDFVVYRTPEDGLYEMTVNDHFSGPEICDSLIAIYPNSQFLIIYRNRFVYKERGKKHIIIDDFLLKGPIAKEMFEKEDKNFGFFYDQNNKPFIETISIRRPFFPCKLHSTQ